MTPDTGRARVIVGNGLTALFSLIISLYAAVSVTLQSLTEDSRTLILILFGTAGGMLALLLGGSWGVDRLCRRKGWDPADRRRLVIPLILLIAILATCTYLAHDAPPLDNDYTWDDIPRPVEQAQESYRVFLTFQRGERHFPDVRTVGLSWDAAARSNAITHAATIETNWNRIAGGRTFIEELNTFEGVADLTEGLHSPMQSFVATRSIVHTYADYALLKTAQGTPETGAAELAKVYAATGRILPYSRALVHKMAWFAITDLCIETAHRIVTHPNCTETALREMQATFPPLTASCASMRAPMMAEYLMVRHTIQTFDPGDDIVSMAGDDPSGAETVFYRLLATPLFFNRNRTLRDLRQFYAIFIDADPARSQDVAQTSEDYMLAYVQSSGIKNIGGRCFIAVGVPSFARAVRQVTITKVKSDLLAMELHLRLGERIKMRDHITGGEYLVDRETGIPYSAGFDATPGTDDDIRLGAD